MRVHWTLSVYFVKPGDEPDKQYMLYDAERGDDATISKLLHDLVRVTTMRYPVDDYIILRIELSNSEGEDAESVR